MVKFNFGLMKWEGLKVDDVMRWESLFPDVDVVKELKVEMPIWLEKNKNNRKAHKKNWTSFILRWLKREQEKGVGR